MSETDVALVRWPDENDRLGALRDQGTPRLLLVQGDLPPPVVDAGLEDWIRVPAGELDLRARVEGLERRSRVSRVASPVLDDDGVLRVEDAWVALPPVECRLTAAMLDRFGAVVSREALAKAGWPAGAPGRNALDVHVLRLRRRLDPVGLAIRTIRSRGYLLERCSRGQIAAGG